MSGTWISTDGGSNWTDLHSNGELQGFGMIKQNMQFQKTKIPMEIIQFMHYLLIPLGN